MSKSFNDVWESGKEQFNQYKQPITKLLAKDSNGANGTRLAEQNGEEENTAYSTYEGAAVHSNKILQVVENSACCGCRKRWQLAILANIGFMISFGIRCNFGAAKNRMFRNYTDPWGRHHVREFNWTETELGVMESSYFYGYLVTQLPAGFLAAKFPPNKLFGMAIGMGAFLNMLLPFAFNSHSDTFVVAVNVLQGLFTGVAYPSMHGVWRYWAPPMERSKLATTAFTGSYAGAVLGLPVSAFLVSYISWGAPFYVYGVAGCIWAVFWFSLTFEKPAFHPTISLEEKKYIEEAIGTVCTSHPTFFSIPWKAIVTSKPVWAIIVANFARSWTFYLLLQNQLTYMRDVLDMNIDHSGLLAALPHAVMGLIVLFGGQAADYLRSNKILSTTAVRKLFNCGGFGGEALFMLIVAYTKSESTAMIALILAVGCSGFAISGFNVNHLDIAPRYAAILMGFSNGIGTLAGLTCPFVTEQFTLHGHHGWTKVFLLASLIHFTGVTFYAVYASGELQDWAEPKEEEQPWNTTVLGNGAGGYGAAARQSDQIKLGPLPTAEQLIKGRPQPPPPPPPPHRRIPSPPLGMTAARAATRWLEIPTISSNGDIFPGESRCHTLPLHKLALTVSSSPVLSGPTGFMSNEPRTREAEMSESESLGSSSGSDDLGGFSQLLATMARPIPQSFTSSPWGSAVSQPMLGGSFGLAPTPPPMPANEIVKCPLCLEPFREPKVLACFHSFCKGCLERQLDSAERIICPQCHMETQLSVHLGLDSLLSDYGLESVLARQYSLDDKGLIFGSPSSTSSSPPLSDSPVEQVGRITELMSASNLSQNTCTGCKSGERASAFCQDCSHFLCSNCKMAHQFMHCFEGHRVQEIPPVTSLSPPTMNGSASNKSCNCLQHRMQPLRFFCISCNLAICRECTVVDHAAPAHHYEPISEVAEKEVVIMERLVEEARIKHQEMLDGFKQVDACQQRLTACLSRANAQLDENEAALKKMIEEQRRKLQKDLESIYSAKQVQLTMVDKRIQQMSEKLGQTIEFTSRLVKYANPTEVMVFKQLLDTRLNFFLNYNADQVSSALVNSMDLDVPSVNGGLAKQSIGTLMGSVRGTISEWNPANGLANSQPAMPPTPIGRPPSRQQLGQSPPTAHSLPTMSNLATNIFSDTNLLRPKNDFEGSSQSLGPFTNEPFNQYDKWSLGVEPSLGLLDNSNLDDSKSDAMYPPSRSQIKRQKMIYHCKFGEFGVMEGQFTEPSGVAVNAQGDIIVADTNNHRIQVFDKEGRFKFQFGECGKRDGQLLYPNRVAVNKMTGDFVVTERSPTHQIQVYNQYGQFLRKFGANILQHPRGVCVDNKGRIIVVECKVMRVIIFDMFGNILQKFSCSRYLEFPNGVCTNEKNEILISDNRAHCIKVFSYEGQFLRQIGGEGVTNYPIGVGINSLGDVVVADNHNNFNLTVFSQDGAMIGALESKVKHAQCFDVALVDDGSVVLASKDYRLYLYRFQQGAQ